MLGSRFSRGSGLARLEIDGRCVGEIRLNDLNSADRRARLVIGIHDPVLRGRGRDT